MSKMKNKSNKWVTLKTGNFDKNSKAIGKIEAELKKYKWNYKVKTTLTGKKYVETGKLRVDSPNRIKFEIFLSENDWRYQLFNA